LRPIVKEKDKFEFHFANVAASYQGATKLPS
jgi:hypothetical protein